METNYRGVVIRHTPFGMFEVYYMDRFLQFDDIHDCISFINNNAQEFYTNY